jgi:hypothetical protein
MTLFGTIVLFTVITQAERKASLSGLMKLNFADAPRCEGRPDFITEVRPEILGGFEKLPQMVLVANEAEYYVESRANGDDVRIHSYQSFSSVDAKENSKIVCGSVKSAVSSRFSLFAPTLIDNTVGKKIGQSLWQFQMLTDSQGFSVWNQRSLAFSEKESLEKNVLKFGGNYRIYQLSHNQFEVVISKEVDGLVQYLSIKYDAVKSI